ncbi:hypothetical protein HPB50_023333 [Hyalomma asiaticum]|uniref:Uncharacterized protein n=1 Tax=Hyalomma asiaticum TaxID=266040 RepID=A0ACB7TTN0_HYAAI|nr:hypothetical protein HPB50_023333 [Hyalomma asiaticum]
MLSRAYNAPSSAGRPHEPHGASRRFDQHLPTKRRRPRNARKLLLGQGKSRHDARRPFAHSPNEILASRGHNGRDKPRGAHLGPSSSRLPGSAMPMVERVHE